MDELLQSLTEEFEAESEKLKNHIEDFRDLCNRGIIIPEGWMESKEDGT